MFIIFCWFQENIEKRKKRTKKYDVIDLSRKKYERKLKNIYAYEKKQVIYAQKKKLHSDLLRFGIQPWFA